MISTLAIFFGALLFSPASANIAVSPEDFATDTWSFPGISNGIQSVTTDPDGNIYLGGYLEAVDDGATLGVISEETTGQGNDEIFLAKTNPNGKREWIIQTGTKKNDRIGSIIFHAGFVYACGSTAHFISKDSVRSGLDDMVVMKFDAKDGKRVWATQDGTAGHDKAWGIAMGDNGLLYLTGYVGGEWAAPTLSSMDMMVATVSPKTGAFISKYQYSSPSLSYGSALTIASDGTVYVGGLRSHRVDEESVTDRAIWKVSPDLSRTSDRTVQMFSNYYVKGIALNAEEDKVVMVGDVFVDTYRKFDVFVSEFNASTLLERFSVVIETVDREFEHCTFVSYLEEDNILLAGKATGRMYAEAKHKGKWAPWVMVVNQVGKVEHVWQKSMEETGWEELEGGALTPSGDLVFAGLAYNSNTYLYDAYFGTFGLKGVELLPAPVPTPVQTPLAIVGSVSGQSGGQSDLGDVSGQSSEYTGGGNEERDSGGTKSVILMASAGVAAFAVGLAAVIGAAIAVHKKRSLRDDFQSPAFGLNDDGIVRRRSTAGPSVVRIPKDFRGDGNNGAKPA